MSDGNWKKNKTFFESVKYASVGITRAFTYGKNPKRFILIAATGLFLNILAGIPIWGYFVWAIGFLGAESAEMFNTAIEIMCDDKTTEYDTSLKNIKDIAAAGVLMWGFVYFGGETALLVMTLMGIT